MLARRHLLSLLFATILPQSAGAFPQQQPSADLLKPIKDIYAYLDAFCKKQDATILLEGLIASLDREKFKKFDLTQEPTWESIGQLGPLIGLQLVRTGTEKAGYLIRQPENPDFFLQYTPRELIHCTERLLAKSPFSGQQNDSTYAALVETLPQLLRANKPTSVKNLSGAEQEQLYTILSTYFAEKQTTGYKRLLHHLRSSQLPDCEFQWFNLFDTGHKVFGYRIRALSPGYHKEVLLSHGFTNNLQGYSDFKYDPEDNQIYVGGLSRVDQQAPPVNESLRTALKALKYEEPATPPLYIPSVYTDTLIKDLKLQDTEIESDPKYLERCGCIIGKQPEKDVILDFLKTAFDLRINASQGRKTITNKPVSRYKSPYSIWLQTSAPGPISGYIQHQLQARQTHLLKTPPLNLEALKAYSFPTFPAHELRARSTDYIRHHVEKKLAKDEKLKVSEADYLVQVAFANRAFAMFCLENGLDEFETPNGLHTMFDSLYVKATPEEDNYHLELGSVDPARKFVTYFSARKSGYGINRPW